MHVFRELRAMSLLVLRSWYRMSPRLRGGRKPEPGRGASAALLRLVFAAIIYNFGFTTSLRIVSQPLPSRAATWAGLGASLFAASIAFALELPTPRSTAQALKSSFLELLPLSSLSKMVLLCAQAFMALPLVLALVISLHRAHAPSNSLCAAAALALMLFVTSALAGGCLAKLLKLVFSPYWAARLSWLSVLLIILAMLLLQAASLSQAPPLPLGDGLGRAIIGESSGQGVALLGVAALLTAGAFAWLDQRQELSEPVRGGPTASAFAKGADLLALERTLTAREPGGSFQVPFLFALTTAIAGLMIYLSRDRGGNPRLAWSLPMVVLAQLVPTLAMQRATRAATRDMLARPLLGALPISPRDTLANKAGLLQRTLSIIAAPTILTLGAAYWHRDWLLPLSWRFAATLVATNLYAHGATYIAFLTAGLGSTRSRSGVFGSIESLLLALPLLSVLFAANPWSALLGLLTLAALAFESRRAALRTIDWIDDAEREHATEVWKALVVFGGFQGLQLLAQQLALLFGAWLSPATQLLGSYSLAGAGLWLMTERSQRTSVPAQRTRFALVGLLGGAFSGGCAWIYTKLLDLSAESTPRLAVTSTASGVLLALALVAVAPLVEERFFRGWLQPALEESLAPQRKLAPVFTALAFAAAHPAHSFPPVLVLGLVNGFLLQRFRSLSACVVAHAVHNAVALVIGS